MTTSRLPSKQAALKGVEFVFVGWFIEAPDLTKDFTTFKWPKQKNKVKLNI